MTDGATFLGLDHAQLAIPPDGVEVARAFWEGVLGLQEMEKPEPLKAMGGAWFRAGSAEIHLGVEADFRPARKAHPALMVNDIDGVAARCAAAGWPIQWDDRYPGVRRFYVHDPFGNRVEILQPL
jgi:catechol 2,3-dioxygenase-like lactoylglutathione lyase family enzyme